MSDELKDYVEIRKMEKFVIKAKNKIDAEKELRDSAISSQDEVIRITSTKTGYEADVAVLICRNWPEGYVPG